MAHNDILIITLMLYYTLVSTRDVGSSFYQREVKAPTSLCIFMALPELLHLAYTKFECDKSKSHVLAQTNYAYPFLVVQILISCPAE